jgi:hypothetical protein
MRIAVIVPLDGRRLDGEASLQALAELRRHGHRVIAVDSGTTLAGRMPAAALADRFVYAPDGWSRQVNAGCRAPEVELADALVFLPEGVRLPPHADRCIARALSNSTSPWGRFDIRYRRVPGLLQWPYAVAAAIANAASRLTGICTREQAIFVSRGAFLALDGYTPVDPRSDRAAEGAVDADFCRRARLLGPPIALRESALVPAPAREIGALLRAVWRRERGRLGMALGLAELR